jgi:Ca2+-transporting ATPase
VLAFARGVGEEERELEFLGLVGLWDPPRLEAKGAVLAARRAGICVLMITGDHAVTARAIAREVGIDADTVIEGETLANDDAALDASLEDTRVFARMKPEHKLRLVERLRARGQVVAMTGDGLNDAPALKRADVGIAMGGRGSDVAREVADVVLLDDNFATILAAVEEGRRIYANVQSFVRFSFSSNVALVILVLGAALGSLVVGLRQGDGALLMPLSALQILWINFLGDGPPALAIALDANQDSLARPPRPPAAPLLDRAAIQFVLLDGSVKGGIGLLLLAVLPWLGSTLAATATAVFLYEGIAKLLSMFPARRLGGRLAANRLVFVAAAVSVLLQLACISFPSLRGALGLTWLSPGELGTVLLALLSTFALGELVLRAVRGASPSVGRGGEH